MLNQLDLCVSLVVALALAGAVFLLAHAFCYFVWGDEDKDA